MRIAESSVSVLKRMLVRAYPAAIDGSSLLHILATAAVHTLLQPWTRIKRRRCLHICHPSPLSPNSHLSLSHSVLFAIGTWSIGVSMFDGWNELLFSMPPDRDNDSQYRIGCVSGVLKDIASALSP